MERQPRKKITRHRELRACTTCRKRKLKCDRQWPCTSCLKSDKAASCVYETTSGELPQSERERLWKAEGKIRELEEKLQQVSPRYGPDVAATTIDPLPVQPSNGLQENGVVHQKQNNVASNSVWREPTHWTSMMDGVDQLESVAQDTIKTHDISTDLAGSGDDGSGWLFGHGTFLPLHAVLDKYLPHKLEADRMVAAYFRKKAVSAPFIHATHFVRRYEEFWRNPLAASPTWTSVLFTIFHITTGTGSRVSENSSEIRTNQKPYAIAAANLLALCEYQKPQPYVVEALLLYAQSRCLVDLDMPSDLGIIFGTLMRLATMMGYHREPDTTRIKLTPFEKEMRRRTWSLCMQLDLLVSFQLGLPVQCPEFDTRPPTNLMDSDFDEDSRELPTARPDSVPTETLFFIAKHKLAAVFRKIMRHTASDSGDAMSSVERLDQELRDTYQALPAVFQSRSMAESIADPPSLIVTRLCVLFIYQKCLCVLHRKYVTQGSSNSIYVCQDAASNLVRQFLEVYNEFSPGGQLETERWFMSSITWHDFLLGCSALCLVTCWRTLRDPDHTAPEEVDNTNSLDLLHRARSICAEQSSRSRDTARVHRLIHMTIQQVRGEGVGSVPSWPSPSVTTNRISLNTPDLTMSTPLDLDDISWDDASLWALDDASWAFLEPLMSSFDDISWTE